MPVRSAQMAFYSGFRARHLYVTDGRYSPHGRSGAVRQGRGRLVA